MHRVGKPKLIREINRKLVLKFLREEHSTTKSKLSHHTSISKQTINNIITSLINDGLVVEAGYGNSTEEGGKKPVILKFNPTSNYLIGSMIGLKKTRAILTDLSANIVAEKSMDTIPQSGHENIIKKMLEMFNELIEETGINKNKLYGIGIGVPGIVDFKKGVVRTLPHVTDWDNIPLGKIIKDEIGVEVFINNENRMRAFGEKWFGLAKNVSNFVTICTGPGIGAGVFINDDIIMGSNLLAGEIGHLKLAVDGPLCACGNRGCFEAFAGTTRITQLAQENYNKNIYKDQPLARSLKEDFREISADEFFIFLSEGDKLANFIMNEIAYWFGIGISAVVSICDPEMVIIHGEYVKAPESFLGRVKETAQKNLLPNISKNVVIKYSDLGKMAGLVGSVSAVLEMML
jgi:predicted NBD/HSP70 family sugar kinase